MSRMTQYPLNKRAAPAATALEFAVHFACRAVVPTLTMHVTAALVTAIVAILNPSAPAAAVD